MSGAPTHGSNRGLEVYSLVTVHNSRFVTQFLECDWIQTLTYVKRVRGNEDLYDCCGSDSFGIFNITSRHQDADTV
jgi:hypothetical protein